MGAGENVLVSGGSSPRYAPTGHIVYGVAGTLRAVGFDPVRLELTTNPIPVLNGVVTKSNGGANFSLADNGSLVYTPATSGTSQRTLMWIDRDGREEPGGADPLPYDNPRVSPDGTRVAVEVDDPRNADLHVYDLERGTLTRLTFAPGADRRPLWTPDGRAVVFNSTRDACSGKPRTEPARSSG